MLFAVFGADCDHVGDIYECPQGTYAIGHRSSTTKQFLYSRTSEQQPCMGTNPLAFVESLTLFRSFLD